MTEAPTEPLFVALASILAAIENSVIQEGEVQSLVVDGDHETTLSVVVRSQVRPVVISSDQDPPTT